MSRLRIVALTFVLASALATCATAANRPPNVVVIFTDDQGTLDARSFGSADLETPAIDRLAAEGVRFTQAYAHTVCCPARAMLLTGRHPQRSGIVTWTQAHPHEVPQGRNLPLSEVTLAEALRDAGYRTGLFGKWHLGAHDDHAPTKQGFDEAFGLRGGFIDNENHYFLHAAGFHDLYDGDKEVFHRGQYFPDLMTDRALAFISRNRARPFFLYYAMNLPHYPEQALARYRERFRDLPEPRRSYAATVATTDHYIGLLLGHLDTLKLTENTVVIFMSDNGHSPEDYKIATDRHPSGYPKGHDYGAHGGAGNTGRWLGAKASFLEGGIRVPAILSYPAKVPKGLVRDQAITALDWFPTVLELCGVTPPAGVTLDGHSVMPLVADAAAPGRYAAMHWAWQGRWAVREGDWKLLFNDRGVAGRTTLEKIHLANLADPAPEATNHAGARPDLVARLTQLHETWEQSVTPPEFRSPLPGAAKKKK